MASLVFSISSALFQDRARGDWEEGNIKRGGPARPLFPFYKSPLGASAAKYHKRYRDILDFFNIIIVFIVLLKIDFHTRPHKLIAF